MAKIRTYDVSLSKAVIYPEFTHSISPDTDNEHHVVKATSLAELHAKVDPLIQAFGNKVNGKPMNAGMGIEYCNGVSIYADIMDGGRKPPHFNPSLTVKFDADHSTVDNNITRYHADEQQRRVLVIPKPATPTIVLPRRIKRNG